MAHFAKLGIDNIVLEILVINNVDTMTPQGEEREEIGVEFLRKLTGHETWKQTSYSRSFRKNYAAIGFTYDSARDAFISPKPYASWTLDENTCGWKPPTPEPTTENKTYSWNESTLSWDEHDLYS
jgi:hypothetical protein